MICGVVLAGGRSRRFGREKAAVEVGGRSLVECAAEGLAQGCASLAINAPVGSFAASYALAHGLPLLADAPGDADGPLAGVKAGLIWAQDQDGDLLATAPCDAPFLPRNMVARLAAALGEADGVAVARTTHGVQPLCALWRVSLLPLVADALAEGRHPPVRGLLADLGAVELLFEEDQAFLNVNTPQAHAEALRSAT